MYTLLNLNYFKLCNLVSLVEIYFMFNRRSDNYTFSSSYNFCSMTIVCVVCFLYLHIFGIMLIVKILLMGKSYFAMKCLWVINV